MIASYLNPWPNASECAKAIFSQLVSLGEKPSDGASAELIDWSGVDQKIADMRAGSVKLLAGQRL